MKKRLKQYLEAKEKREYDALDRILEMYLTGELKKRLSAYSGVGIYPSFCKDGKTIQLNYHFNNIYVAIDFFEDNYRVVVYYAGISPDDLEKLSVEYNYQDDFDLRILIEEIDSQIKHHSKLKDTTSIEKKKKVYSLIAWMSLCVPLVLFGGIGLYGVITDSVVQLNMWWWIFFGVIPVIIWFVLDVKSKRLK